MGLKLGPEFFEKAAFAFDQAVKICGNPFGGHGFVIMTTHGKVTIASHFAREPGQAVSEVTVLGEETRISLVFTPGVGIRQIEGRHVDFEIVGHGVHELSESAVKGRMLGETLAASGEPGAIIRSGHRRLLSLSAFRGTNPSLRLLPSMTSCELHAALPENDVSDISSEIPVTYL
jgi:hypothetical protein